MRKLFFFAIVMIAFCQMAFSQIEVNSTGQVGIGVTPNSNYRLYVGNGNTFLDEYLGCNIPKSISKVQLCINNIQCVQNLIGDGKTSEAKNMILTK